MTIDEAAARGFADHFHAVETEVGKSIIGQNELIQNVLAAVIIGGNVLLEGLPGLGKTQLVRALGMALDLRISRIQFTPDLMPADVTGTDIFVKNADGTGSFAFQEGPVFTNLLLADEINRATPKTQSALLEAMQEKTVTIGKNTYPLPPPFFVLATQNPLELEGTYPLPEAQLDRFIIKLDVGFPSRSELLDIVNLTTGSAQPEVQKVLDCEKLSEMSRVCKMIPVSRAVGEYAMDLIVKTHPELESAPSVVKKYVRYGASPRGAQALIGMGRVFALLDGRFNVAYDDIKKASTPCLRHRLFLNYDALSERVEADQVIDELLRGMTPWPG